MKIVAKISWRAFFKDGTTVNTFSGLPSGLANLINLPEGPFTSITDYLEPEVEYEIEVVFKKAPKPYK